jgi:transcriptional regulator with GAF, ATPase, and Fis domain
MLRIIMARERENAGAADEARATQAVDPKRERFASVQRFRLLVRRGSPVGAELTSSAERTVIGTHPSCDLVLDDATVSRFHCEIVAAPGRLEIRDLGSLNGTNLNGVSVLRAHVPSSGTLVLGNTELQIELRPDPVQLVVSERGTFGKMVGESSEMRRVFSVLERIAAGDATVLIEGETGTGKELAAESIHFESARRDGPFVVVDCSAVPTQLLESELFGHERGAFTGASSTRAGAFELAQGGTIFLDEIGELALDLQPKLLRALERKEIKRVGTGAFTKVDVRVISATNRDLRGEVNAKRFRPDLYYRLAVVDVRLPPLRDRADDIPRLVDDLLEGLGVANRPEAEGLRSTEFLAALAMHPWPGNVRELRNYLDRCVTLRETAPMPPAGGAVPEPIEEPAPGISVPLKVARTRWTRTFERRYLLDMMAKHDGNVSRAARAAEVDRMYFYRLLWRHGLR